MAQATQQTNKNKNNTKGVNGDGGYPIIRGVQQCIEPPIHHLQGNGNKGSTSPKHMQQE
jgi:hypothetical protein